MVIKDNDLFFNSQVSFDQSPKMKKRVVRNIVESNQAEDVMLRNGNNVSSPMWKNSTDLDYIQGSANGQRINDEDFIVHT